MISGEAWAIAGAVAAGWLVLLVALSALAVRSGLRRAGREGRLPQVRERLKGRSGSLTIFVVVWLLGNITAVFVAALVVAALVID